LTVEGEPEIQEEAGRGIRDQIVRYRVAMVAVVSMIVFAAFSGGYILAHERLSLPGWVPVLGHEYVVLKGEFQTAQAVAPGQGQSVTIAGAKIGEIESVDLHEGRALVTMKVTPSYARYIYRDATMLLRPKTQLKDETVEIDPGSPASGRVPDGYTIPVDQTAPDGNLDEFLASLDGDTRAYLQELLAGAGEGLNDNAANLSATLKRFAPLALDLQKIGSQVAVRQSYVASAIHNFRLLAEALGEKNTQIAALVDSSNAVFATFAQQDRQVQETLRELPGVLGQANKGLGQLATAAHVVGPTLTALEPTAKGIAPAERAGRALFIKTTPVLKNEIRPFLRQILPVLDEFQPSVQAAAQSFPKLTTSFTVVDELFNELAYNPGPNQPGFLFDIPWGAHDLDSVVSQGDAHGSFGDALAYFNCNVVPLLNSVASINPTANLILGLLNPPSPALCKSVATAAAPAAKAAGLRGPLAGGMARLAGDAFGQRPGALLAPSSADAGGN
jgi:phospholipid/cholesterol/gamma-HCH transport system substrate-binding protein